MSDFLVPSGARGGRTTVPTSQAPGQTLTLGGAECVGSGRTRRGHPSVDDSACGSLARGEGIRLLTMRPLSHSPARTQGHSSVDSAAFEPLARAHVCRQRGDRRLRHPLCKK